jgi:hypothetical protein
VTLGGSWEPGLPERRSRETLSEIRILLQTEQAQKQSGLRQRIEMAFSSLTRVFGLGKTFATTLIGSAIRIAAKITAYTYAFLVNRFLGRPPGRLKELWACDLCTTNLAIPEHRQTWAIWQMCPQLPGMYTRVVHGASPFYGLTLRGVSGTPEHSWYTL